MDSPKPTQAPFAVSPVRDRNLLFLARAIRTFAYGFFAASFSLYLESRGISSGLVGVVFSVALAGGAILTTSFALIASRWGRRRLLQLTATLMILGGALVASSTNRFVLLVAAAIGMLSPSGQEIGPFMSLEQAIMSGVSEGRQTWAYAWYNLIASFSTAFGALVAGLSALAPHLGITQTSAEGILMWAYAAVGLVLLVLYSRLGPAAEVKPTAAGPHAPLHRSRKVVLQLTALFGVDAMAGGLVVQGMLALWFHQRFGIGLGVIGPILSAANLLSGLSFLLAARLADRFGLLNTMVFSHLPSNVLLMLVPFMPNLPLAALVLLARFALSQMDVPTRQAYTMAIVEPDERAAAAGLTNAVRPAASVISPTVSGLVLSVAGGAIPFVLSGGLKVVYDLSLYAMLRKVPVPGESRQPA